ncbi:MAG: pentapeptide repeat-containing protein [Synechococcales bacterium]|nr:pentapeptide repeat-containing protein [Synechococcales bacterium]
MQTLTNLSTALTRSPVSRRVGYWMRVRRRKFFQFITGTANFALTVGSVLLALGAALSLEFAIQYRVDLKDLIKAPDATIAQVVEDVRIRADGSEIGILTFLKDSIILDNVEGVSIITAMVLFLRKGRQEEKRQAHYMAWLMIDIAYEKETSYARFQALQDLHTDGLSLKGLDAPNADLIGIDLDGADLHQATLKNAKLMRANLRRVQLDCANLQQVDLQQANLRDAGLLNANLSGAHLGGTDLSRADLRNANLQNADLLFANLKDVAIAGADLAGANFRRARNLDPNQIKQAKNWELAIFDDAFRHRLKAPSHRFQPRIVPVADRSLTTDSSASQSERPTSGVRLD